MNRQKIDIFVSHIGINRVYLSGTKLENYAKLPNSELTTTKIPIGGTIKIIQTLILEFPTSGKTIDFLEEMVERGIPFADDHKSNAFFEASKLREEGKIQGNIIGC